MSEAQAQAYDEDRLVTTRKLEELVGQDAPAILNINGGDDARWQRLHWTNDTYEELLETKLKYDKTGLFVCHHCVGSEMWDTTGNCEV